MDITHSTHAPSTAAVSGVGAAGERAAAAAGRTSISGNELLAVDVWSGVPGNERTFSAAFPAAALSGELDQVAGFILDPLG